MRNPFLEVIEIRPRRGPRALLAWMAMLFVLALLAIALADLSAATRAAASAAAGVGAVVEWYRLFGPHGVPVSASLRPDGRWSLVSARGARIEACLVRAWGGGLGPVVGLEWRAVDSRRYRAWVTRRHLASPTDWRRLRVRLRFA